MSSLSTPQIEWRGRLPYGQALEEQRARREQILAGESGECVWALEHDPVVTAGRRTVSDLPKAEFFAERGIDFFQTERGGLATYHGPGQLVGYFMLNLIKRNLKVREMISGLEEGVIRWLAQRKVTAYRRCGFPGVWVNGDKLCSVGMHFRRGVSMHGFALNLTTDLRPFELITPCGITDARVISLEQVNGESVRAEDVAFDVIREVIIALQLTHTGCVDTSETLPGM